MDKQQRWYADEIELHDQVVADVGANVGKLSQFFWDAGKGTNKVVSIEPLPQNIKRLKTRIARSKSKKWTLLPCAVSSQTTELRLERFHSTEQGWNASALKPGQSVSSSPGAKEVVVQAKPLSALVPNATVVKLDIEGHEYAVIDEAISTLKDVHTWAVELHMIEERPLEQVIQQFEQHGYTVFAASQQRGDPEGRWVSVPVTSSLTWAQIPVAKHMADGRVFKMLHIIAKRQH